MTHGLWSHFFLGNKVRKLLGRHIFKPKVFLNGNRYHGPKSQAEPFWHKIYSKKYIRGEILSMLELIEVRMLF